jgi:tetratricopeptide (TPR) repeat protein
MKTHQYPQPAMKKDASHRQQRLAECYDRGMRLMTQERDHDYAHLMFTECVLNDHANLRYVEALLQNLREQFTGHARRSWRVFGHSGNKKLRRAVDGKSWKSAFRMGVDLLKDNPWDVATLRALAEACEALHYNEVELAYLKQALDACPRNADINRHCGRSLARMGQFDQAIACWHRVEEIKTGDVEAACMVAQLYEEKLKYANGQPAPIQRQVEEVGELTGEAPSDEGASDVVLTPRQQLERAIAENPSEASNYLQLADLLGESEQFENAEAMLLRGIAACGEVPLLTRRLQRVRELLVKRNMTAAESRRAKAEKDARQFHVPWLELVLASAVALLILQIIPSTAEWLQGLFDVSQWSRTRWIVLNMYVLLLLVAIRFGPELHNHWRKL